MTKKTIAITLAVLLILPALCFAGDVEIKDIRIRWIKAYGTDHYLSVQIPVTNNTDEAWGLHGKLQFLDKDGLEIHFMPIWTTVRPGETRIVPLDSRVSRKDYEKTATFKLSVKAKFSSFLRRGEPPFVIEKILTLPPWE